MQNKANFAAAELILIALQEKDYGRTGGLCVRKNKANLAGGWLAALPGTTGTGEETPILPHSAGAEAPSCKTKPICKGRNEGQLLVK
jgi:hypothetical protein